MREESCQHSPFEINYIHYDHIVPYNTLAVCQGCNQTIDGYGQNINYQYILKEVEK